MLIDYITDSGVLVRGGVVLPMSDGKLSTEKSTYYKVDVIASLFNLTVRRIQQLTQEGILPTVETLSGRRYDLVPTIQRYIKYLSDKAYGKSHSDAENELKRQKHEKEIELKELQGEYRSIQNAIAHGKYIGVDKV
jgi:phage terminase Nu1 subunit (DNA packaging protein)